MAGTAIVRKDTRLLLFQALERGSFEGSFLQKMKKDGAGMTYEFAKKYYKVTLEIHLIHASYCVLGIINFGLHLLSDSDPDKAVQILRTKSLMDIFQAGWIKISGLAEIKIHEDNEWVTDDTKGAKDWHKEISERLLSDPQREWEGLEEFQKLKEESAAFERRHRLFNFFRQEFDPKNPQSGKTGVYKMDANKPAIMLDTYYISLLVSDIPKAPLNIEELVQIIQLLSDEKIAEKLQDKLQNLQEIPAELQAWHQEQITLFLKTISFYQNILSHKGEKKLYDQFLSDLYIMADADNTSKFVYDSAKKAAKEISNGTVWSLITALYETNDASARLAILDLIFEEPEKLTGENLTDVIKIEDIPWQQKLDWRKISQQTFEGVLESDFRSEIIADIFAQNQQTMLLPKWDKLPGYLLLKIMCEDKKIRDFFLKNLKKSHRILEMEDVSVDVFVLLVPLSGWVKMWKLMDTIHGPVIFERMRNFYQQLGFNAKQTNQLLFERIKLIAKFCRGHKEYHDIEVNPAPFYSDLFKEAVQNAYPGSQFNSLKKKLLLELK
ncbi:MAG: hypothetical protein NTX82_01085 [Candidatus Parcubacteria bacterium]|nr:hypothetical protein [Candidatus Parcubacteria bacterium]